MKIARDDFITAVYFLSRSLSICAVQRCPAGPCLECIQRGPGHPVPNHDRAQFQTQLKLCSGNRFRKITFQIIDDFPLRESHGKQSVKLDQSVPFFAGMGASESESAFAFQKNISRIYPRISSLDSKSCRAVTMGIRIRFEQRNVFALPLI